VLFIEILQDCFNGKQVLPDNKMWILLEDKPSPVKLKADVFKNGI